MSREVRVRRRSAFCFCGTPSFSAFFMWSSNAPLSSSLLPGMVSRYRSRDLDACCYAPYPSLSVCNACWSLNCSCCFDLGIASQLQRREHWEPPLSVQLALSGLQRELHIALTNGRLLASTFPCCIGKISVNFLAYIKLPPYSMRCHRPNAAYLGV